MNGDPLRVVLVDDEPPILQRLRTMDWKRFGVDIVGEAENGEEALDLCARELPDIVFTDIKMPVMTGLDLLKQVSQEYPETAVVLLTSYTDFDYARQALQWGASDYLMKVTFNEDELAVTIERAKKWLRSRLSQKEHERREARRRMSQGFRRMLKQPPEQAQRHLRELLAPEPPPEAPFRFARILLQVSREDELFIDQEAQSVLHELQTKSKPESGDYWFWFPSNTGDYLVWFPHRKETAELTAQVKRIQSGIRARLAAGKAHMNDDAAVFAIVSSEVEEYGRFRDVFRETFYWLDHFFYEPQGLMIDRPEPLRDLDEKSEFELRTRFRHNLTDRRGMTDYLRAGFKEWVLQQRLRPSGIKQFLLAELQEWAARFREGAVDREGLARRVEQSATLDGLISNVIYWLEQKRDDFVRTEIRRARELVHARLGEPITLSAIAQEVNLSIDYFGRIFHEELGETFKEYVTRCRIEKAIELLQTTNLKVYAVSERVGFPSYRYFALLFRKVTGLSPSDYKRG